MESIPQILPKNILECNISVLNYIHSETSAFKTSASSLAPFWHGGNWITQK